MMEGGEAGAWKIKSKITCMTTCFSAVVVHRTHSSVFGSRELIQVFQ